MRSSFFQQFEFGIFDLDGTLINTMPVYTQTFAEILTDYGLSEKESREFYTSTCGRPLEEQFKTILSEQGTYIAKERLEQLIKNFFEKVRQTPLNIYSGVEELLRDLRQKGLTLFVTTGSQDPEEMLETAGIRYYFSTVMGSRVHPKGPEHIHEFAKAVKIEVPAFCNRSFFVGDGPADMALARKMLIYAIGVAHTLDGSFLSQAGADEVIDKISDLMYL